MESMSSKDKTTIGAFRGDAKRIKRRKLEDDDLNSEPEALEKILDEKDELEQQVDKLQNRIKELEKSSGGKNI